MNTKQLIDRIGVTQEQADEVMRIIYEDTQRDLERFMSVRALIGHSYHPPKRLDLTLTALNEVLEGYGVEAIFGHHDELRAEYINLGDTYTPTVLFDHRKHKFFVTSWGDFVESRRL